MESTAYFHRIYGIVPWNPLNFHGINGKNLWHFMNFHNFLLLVYLPSTAMETLKMPSEYSVDFNRGFQGFSMANLETGDLGPNCLQRLSGDDTSSQRDKTWIQTNPMQPSKYMWQCNTTLEPSH